LFCFVLFVLLLVDCGFDFRVVLAGWLVVGSGGGGGGRAPRWMDEFL
jgi:hypothetical protein